METNTLLDTRPVYSNETAFNLIEEFLLGRTQKRIARMVHSFHPEIEFRGINPTEPTVGMENFTERMSRLLQDTNDFYFKLKKVTWDETLLTGTAIIEYRYNDIRSKKGYMVWEIATFEIEGGLIKYYISAKEILDSWEL